MRNIWLLAKKQVAKVNMYNKDFGPMRINDVTRSIANPQQEKGKFNLRINGLTINCKYLIKVLAK